jgi:hypothetical protein
MKYSVQYHFYYRHTIVHYPNSYICFIEVILLKNPACVYYKAGEEDILLEI